jgi:hypothetical protein
MGGPDVGRIAENYAKLKIAMSMAQTEVVQSIISAAMLGMDLGLIGYVVSWAVKKVMGMLGMDPSTKALSVALRVDYLRRSKDPMKAWNLINRCSICKCIGHNKRVS